VLIQFKDILCKFSQILPNSVAIFQILPNLTMSFNQFMHPRNIYRIRPDYNQLSKQYPEFGDNVLYDDAGNVHVNYKDMKSLRALTRTLLKNDFQLDVVIPEGRLVPTLPMRLNYLLWIEDLLGTFPKDDKEEDVIGFDIGTGCCSIFPLLGVRMNSNWNFIASDIDSETCQMANNNIERNNLQDRIKGRHFCSLRLLL